MELSLAILRIIKYNNRSRKTSLDSKRGKNMQLKNLTDCEQLVMKTLWDADKEIGLMEITKRVNETYHKDWKPQTVSTFLARLVRKSYLESYRQGRVFLYRILVSQEDYVGEMAERFIAFWNCGSVEAFLAALERRRSK